VLPLDFFPQTAHVEVAVALERGDPNRGEHQKQPGPEAGRQG
jgi:hypothetical protein